MMFVSEREQGSICVACDAAILPHVVPTCAHCMLHVAYCMLLYVHVGACACVMCVGHVWCGGCNRMDGDATLHLDAHSMRMCVWMEHSRCAAFLLILTSPPPPPPLSLSLLSVCLSLSVCVCVLCVLLCVAGERASLYSLWTSTGGPTWLPASVYNSRIDARWNLTAAADINTTNATWQDPCTREQVQCTNATGALFTGEATQRSTVYMQTITLHF